MHQHSNQNQPTVSQRLQAILDITDQAYDQIWDTCCDHGYLGEAYLLRKQAQTVHFVDRVPALMYDVEQRLAAFGSAMAIDDSAIDSAVDSANNSAIEPSTWQVHCLDVKQLKLEGEQRHLIIVAGVGGDLCADIVTAIVNQHPFHDIDWILCPVHKHETLRKKLMTLNLHLVNEHLVKDKGRIYEVMHVNHKVTTPVSVVGQQIWFESPVLAKEYLAQKIAHFERKANSSECEAIDILVTLNAIADDLSFKYKS
jgi:tRNA (adenine22-N1)-methyltransferase